VQIARVRLYSNCSIGVIFVYSIRSYQPCYSHSRSLTLFQEMGRSKINSSFAKILSHPMIVALHHYNDDVITIELLFQRHWKKLNTYHDNNSESLEAMGFSSNSLSASFATPSLQLFQKTSSVISFIMALVRSETYWPD
jgi:hypothetical protein